MVEYFFLCIDLYTVISIFNVCLFKEKIAHVKLFPVTH